MLPTPSTQGSPPAKKVRRPRALQACNFCRAKKYKCDGVYPCSHCRRLRVDCQFKGGEPGLTPFTPSNPQEYIKDLEAKLESAKAAVRAPDASIAAASPIDTTEHGQRLPSTPGDSQQPGGSLKRRNDSGALAHPSVGSSTGNGQQRTDVDESSTDESGTEVVDVNPMTKAIEFHGNTSSVAFLGRLHREYNAGANNDQQEPSPNDNPSLVGAFHNADFSPLDSTGISSAVLDDQFFCPQAYIFLDSYFNSIHYVHPIIEKESFTRRCEDLWHGFPERQHPTFFALYYSVMSLGALIRFWGGEKINGMGRYSWSRMLFERAQAHLGRPAFANNIEAIQCLFIMAKICQNELNPNFAYMYLGMAIRTSLSAGINRKTPTRGEQPADPEASAKSRTWWGLYSLEIELSFALGRPDTLGMDEHHNRPMPIREGSPYSLITCMVDMARIVRRISISIYLQTLTLADRIFCAFEIEKSIDAWVDSLPAEIRPSMTPAVYQSGTLNDPPWAPPQRLVLQMRYYNVKMLLFRPLLIHSTKPSDTDAVIRAHSAAVEKCIDAAIQTIETVYQTYRAHVFFRTWWYNVTYITFAASILLFEAARLSRKSFNDARLTVPVEHSIELLDAMQESVVARKTSTVLRQLLERLRSPFDSHNPTSTNATRQPHAGPYQPQMQHTLAEGRPIMALDEWDVLNVGPDFGDGTTWNLGFDFPDIWDFDGTLDASVYSAANIGGEHGNGRQ